VVKVGYATPFIGKWLVEKAGRVLHKLRDWLGKSYIMWWMELRTLLLLLLIVIAYYYYYDHHYSLLLFFLGPTQKVKLTADVWTLAFWQPLSSFVWDSCECVCRRWSAGIWLQWWWCRVQRSLIGFENETIEKQQEELQLLTDELQDRERELDEMVAAHQRQLEAWQQDSRRAAGLEYHCSQLHSESFIRSVRWRC